MKPTTPHHQRAGQPGHARSARARRSAGGSRTRPRRSGTTTRATTSERRRPRDRSRSSRRTATRRARPQRVTDVRARARRSASTCSSAAPRVGRRAYLRRWLRPGPARASREDDLATLERRPARPHPRSDHAGDAQRASCQRSRRSASRRARFDLQHRGRPDTRFHDQRPAVRPRQRARRRSRELGTTERWTCSTSRREWHPIHIHQDDFRVSASTARARRVPRRPGHRRRSARGATASPATRRDRHALHGLLGQLRLPLPHPRPRGRRADVAASRSGRAPR